jgi:outer membrane protein OmpA-like peptidoglycan-associated protein
MNAILNLKNRFVLIALFATTALSAQNQIQYTRTDEKYGNTTVVYTKDSNYNDMDILSQLDDSYGVGDVVRIAVAPKQNTEMLASDDASLMFAAAKPAQKEPAYSLAKPVPQKKTEVVETPKKEVAASAPVVKTTKQTAVIGTKTVKKGSIFRLEKLYFDADKFELKSESEEELQRLYTFLNDNPSVTIEVRGHTNNQMWPNVDFANELSSNRAKAVADWLVGKGISASRIQHKGYGWTMPVEPNITAEGRKKNQRVEVKVLSM